MEKIPSSQVLIRFQDCDPFNHLNNSKYLDYFINAREDQILEHYKLDIFSMAQKEKKGWVVTLNQIAYFIPAFPNEKVIIQTQLIDFTEKNLKVECTMWDQERSRLKSVIWTQLTHVGLTSPGSIPHTPELMDLFTGIHSPVEEKEFEKRAMKLKAEFNSR